MSNWLDKLRNGIIELTSPAARKLWPSRNQDHPAYFNYRLEHVRQVERDIMLLQKKLGGDRDILFASVWIHDRFQSAFKGDNHGKLASEWALKNLELLGFPKEKIADVCFSIANHSNLSHTLPEKPIEARILWDADKLAHLGSFEIMILVLNHLTDDMIGKMQTDPNYTNSPYTIEYLLGNRMKRLDLNDSAVEKFYYPISKQTAAERIKVQKDFYDCLKKQIVND